VAKKKKAKKKTTKTGLPIADKPEKVAEAITETNEVLRGSLEIDLIREFGEDLYNRAKKTVGMSNAQIASYADADALLQALNGMHPKSNPDARVKEGKRPEIKVFEENMPDSFTLESVLEAKFIKTNRDHYDRGNLQSFLCRIRRRYGEVEPVRIIQDRNFKVVKRELTTTYTIYFKE
jgi:hypothetical protein